MRIHVDAKAGENSWPNYSGYTVERNSSKEEDRQLVMGAVLGGEHVKAVTFISDESAFCLISPD